MKEIKAFIKMLESEYRRHKADLATCVEGTCNLECRKENEHFVAAYTQVMESWEYEALKSAIKVKENQNEWIEWKGGKCPIEKKSTIVEMKLNDGTIISNTADIPASVFPWESTAYNFGIAAYRLIGESHIKELKKQTLIEYVNKESKDHKSISVTDLLFWISEFLEQK